MKCPKCQTDNLGDSGFCRACAEPLNGPEKAPVVSTKTIEIPPSLSLSGTVFAGRFQVVEELGRGGMGVVYRAFDTRLREEVALKVIKPEIASDKKALERFSTELKLARRIVHRNVCRMYELMEHQGVRFISMEYVPGEDLKSFIKRARRLDIGAAVAIGIQVCEGLAEAHRLGVVHRDLKPGNIMIDKEGNAKIMDFGIARSRLEKGITGEGRMIGTPEYISPEQIDGEVADARADLYALGVILFEMVCGTYPFEGDTAQIIAQKIHGKKPPDPKTINPHVPDALSKVILKSLEKNPDKRSGSAADVVAELRQIENDLPTSERITVKARSSVISRLSHLRRKRKILSGVLGLAAFAIAAVLLTRPWSGPAPAGPVSVSRPTLAVLFFANRTNEKSLEVWQRSLCTKFISSIRQLSPGLSVVRQTAIYSYLKKLHLDSGEYSDDDLAEIAKESGASHILTGQLMKVGDNLQIYYDLEDTASRTVIGSDNRTGKPEELDAMVAELSEQVLLNLRLPAQGRVRPIGSASDPANRLYWEARDLEIRAALSREKSERDALLSRLFEKYREAIEIDDGFAAAYWGLGDYYGHLFVQSNDLQDLNLMKEDYERAYELDPQLAGANAGLGWTRFYDQRLDDAYSYFSEALRLAPDDPEINVNFGSFLFSIGQIEAGIRYFTKAIEFGDAPVVPLGAYYLRALSSMNIGRLAEADKDVRAMIAFDPQDVSLGLFHARLLAKMKKADEAERELARIEGLNSAAPDLPYVRAYLYAGEGDRAKALPILEKAAKENPLFFSYFLSENYAQLGMADEAIAVIQEGIKKGFSKVFNYLYPYQVLKNGAYEKLRDDSRFRQILESQKAINDAQFEKYRDLSKLEPKR